jgi:hypothetical protein
LRLNALISNALVALAAGHERDRVQHAVEHAPALLEVGDDGGQVPLVGDVELEDVGRAGQPLGHALRQPHRPAEAGEHDLGALLLRAARDGVGDRAVRQDAGDQELLAVEEAHAPHPDAKR